MTMTSSTLGVGPKTKSSSFSLFHEVISQFNEINAHEDLLNITLLLVMNCCQAQECRVIIAKVCILDLL